jgi:hypothetical protein
MLSENQFSTGVNVDNCFRIMLDHNMQHKNNSPMILGSSSKCMQPRKNYQILNDQRLEKFCSDMNHIEEHSLCSNLKSACQDNLYYN